MADGDIEVIDGGHLAVTVGGMLTVTNTGNLTVHGGDFQIKETP